MRFARWACRVKVTEGVDGNGEVGGPALKPCGSLESELPAEKGWGRGPRPTNPRLPEPGGSLTPPAETLDVGNPFTPNRISQALAISKRLLLSFPRLDT
jgi:hypothetical protein